MVPAVAVAAPVLSAQLSRVVKIPIVVFEIALGILVGPSVLHLAQTSDFLDQLSNYGLAMLFFLAGYEIDFARIAGRPLDRAVIGWLLSLVVGVGVGIALEGGTAGVFVGIALTSTALGTIMPVLRDAGELRTPFGIAATAIGAAGEFGPLIAISIFLSGHRPGRATIILLIFVLIAAGAIWYASQGRHARMHRLINATLHTSGQFAVRLVVFVVAALVALSLWLGLDMLLGAFAAGVLMRLLLVQAPAAERRSVEGKLEAVGFGFLVPVFFIHTGITYNLQELLDDTRAVILLPIFLVIFLVVRGLSGLIASPRGATGSDRVAIVLFSATALPIIVAVMGLGVADGAVAESTAASLVGAGMLSVLLFPLLGLAQRRRSATAPAVPVPDPDDEIEVPDEA